MFSKPEFFQEIIGFSKLAIISILEQSKAPQSFSEIEFFSLLNQADVQIDNFEDENLPRFGEFSFIPLFFNEICWSFFDKIGLFDDVQADEDKTD